MPSSRPDLAAHTIYHRSGSLNTTIRKVVLTHIAKEYEAEGLGVMVDFIWRKATQYGQLTPG